MCSSWEIEVQYPKFETAKEKRKRKKRKEKGMCISEA
jgi:hypothetical protein